eukprot:495223-Rhodomonas_salina.2
MVLRGLVLTHCMAQHCSVLKLHGTPRRYLAGSQTRADPRANPRYQPPMVLRIHVRTNPGHAGGEGENERTAVGGRVAG